ncbi:MAG: MFS transporter [Gammaproteobacteria bacterium]|nr:MFS transporter [Gammaproteobacteria bacterium]
MPSFAQTARITAAGLACMLVGIGLARFGFMPMIPLLVERSGFSPHHAALLGGANFLGYLGGTLIMRRRGATVPVRLGSVLMLLGAAASFLAFLWTDSFAQLALWRWLSGAVGAGLMVLVGPAVLESVPPQWRGRCSGLVFAGIGVGALLSGAMTPLLLPLGTKAIWIGFALIAALAAVLAGFGLPNIRPFPAASPQTENHRMDAATIRVVLAYGCCGFGFVPHALLWSDFVARELGRGVGGGASQLMLLGGGAAIGPAVLGLMADRIGFRRAFWMALLAMAGAVAMPLLSVAAPALIVSSVLTGALGIGLVTLASGRLGELLPRSAMTRAWATATLSFAGAQALGALSLPWLLVRPHGSAMVFALASAVLIAGAVLGVWPRSVAAPTR